MTNIFPIMHIGVLALQGAFLEHIAAFTRIGIAAREVSRCVFSSLGDVQTELPLYCMRSHYRRCGHRKT